MERLNHHCQSLFGQSFGVRVGVEPVVSTPSDFVETAGRGRVSDLDSCASFVEAIVRERLTGWSRRIDASRFRRGYRSGERDGSSYSGFVKLHLTDLIMLKPTVDEFSGCHPTLL